MLYGIVCLGEKKSPVPVPGMDADGGDKPNDHNLIPYTNNSIVCTIWIWLSSKLQITNK